MQCRCLLIFSDNMGGVPHHLINFGSQLAIPREHDQQPPWRATGRPARPVHRVFTCTCSSCTLTFTCTFTEEKTSDQHLPSWIFLIISGALWAPDPPRPTAAPTTIQR